MPIITKDMTDNFFLIKNNSENDCLLQIRRLHLRQI